MQNDPKKIKEIMFELYNLRNPMEHGAINLLS
jgi:hypothetical protein